MTDILSGLDFVILISVSVVDQEEKEFTKSVLVILFDGREVGGSVPEAALFQELKDSLLQLGHVPVIVWKGFY